MIGAPPPSFLSALLLGLALAAGVGALWTFGLRGAAEALLLRAGIIEGRTPPPPAAALLPDAGREIMLWTLGSSLTARGDWPDQLAEALAACRGAPVALRRIARPGAGSAWGEPALRAALAEVASGAAAAPDVALIEFAVNDASLAHGEPPWSATARQARILDALAVLPRPPVAALLLTGPAWGREAWERPGLDAYFHRLRDLAAQRRIAAIDLDPAWRALPAAERRRLVPDGLHPTDEGMARILTPAALAALRPALCAPGAP